MASPDNVVNLNPLLNAALLYASRGWRVFPLRSIANGKCSCGNECKTHPHVKEWQNIASCDPMMIHAWWREWPDANIAIATGRQSNLFVVDTDSAKGEALLASLGVVPITLTVKTDRGKHRYFQAGLNDLPTFSGQKRKDEDGLDVRGEGGYVVAPPSQHLSGSIYSWEIQQSPALLPDSIISWMIARKQQPISDALPSTERTTDFIDCKSALDIILNPDLSWDEWNNNIMALYNSTNGSPEGLQLAHYYSKMSKKYNEKTTNDRWATLSRHPPTKTGFGALANKARAINPKWFAPSWDNSYKGPPLTILGYDEVANRPPASTTNQLSPILQTNPIFQIDSTFPVFRASDWKDISIEPMHWLVNGRIPSHDVTILSGDGGQGKTTIALQLAVSVAAMRGEWLGSPCANGGVIVFSGEEDKNEMRRRLASISNKYGVNPDNGNNLYFHFAEPEKALLAIPTREGGLVQTLAFTAFIGFIKQIKPALVIVDNVAATFGGNHIDRVQVRTFVSMFRQICRDVGCAILLLDHPSQAGMSDGTGRSGSMDWRNSVRAFMYIRTAKDEEDKSIRELEVMKINSGRTGEIKKLYYEDGCFVIHDEGQENFLQAVKINAAEVTYVDCLAICTKRSQNVSSSIGPNYAPKVFSSMREANNYSSILLAKAQDSLFKNGTIHMVEYGPPSKIRFKIELKAKW